MPHRPSRLTSAALALLLSAGIAHAQNTSPEPSTGATVLLKLESGESFRGVLVERTAETVAIDHAVLGRLTIPAVSVASIEAAPDTGPPVVQPNPPGAIVPVEDEPKVPDPVKLKLGFFEGWTGSFDLGLFGSEGNTQRITLRTGIGAKRLTDETSTTFDARYFYGKEDGDVTDQKARIDVRNDWLPDEGSRWRPFAQGSFEYDEFQDWNIRLAAFVGMGYEIIKNDTTLLIGRAGIGASREIGGMDNSIRPEGLLGVDFEHKINDRQKITATADYYPDLDQFGEFRAVAKAAWEILLDPDSNITLKVGVEDRYDSTPQGAKHNDLDYFATIVIPF